MGRMGISPQAQQACASFKRFSRIFHLSKNALISLKKWRNELKQARSEKFLQKFSAPSSAHCLLIPHPVKQPQTFESSCRGPPSPKKPAKLSFLSRLVWADKISLDAILKGANDFRKSLDNAIHSNLSPALADFLTQEVKPRVKPRHALGAAALAFALYSLGCAGNGSAPGTAAQTDETEYELQASDLAGGLNTRIKSKPPFASNSPDAKFGFRCSAPPCTYRCKLDDRSWKGCGRPKTYTGLVDGEHTFKVKAIKDGVTDHTPAKFSWTIDTVIPGQIDDLFAQPSTQAGEKVGLDWTSSGDDGFVGSPDHFIIAYSATPITTEAQWNNATLLTSVAATGPVGTTYSMDLDIPAGTWYLAIRAVDEAGNKSVVSNSPDATIKDKPTFYVDKWLPSDDIDLIYEETVAMIQGEGSIPSNSRVLAEQLIKCSSPSFPGTVDNLEDGLLTATNGILSPTDEEYWGINKAFLLDAPTSKVRTYYETAGNAIDYNTLDATTINNIKGIIRAFLIQYTGAHPEDYGNLDPSFNPSW